MPEGLIIKPNLVYSLATSRALLPHQNLCGPECYGRIHHQKEDLNNYSSDSWKIYEGLSPKIF